MGRLQYIAKSCFYEIPFDRLHKNTVAHFQSAHSAKALDPYLYIMEKWNKI